MWDKNLSSWRGQTSSQSQICTCTLILFLQKSGDTELYSIIVIVFCFFFIYFCFSFFVREKKPSKWTQNSHLTVPEARFTNCWRHSWINKKDRLLCQVYMPVVLCRLSKIIVYCLAPQFKAELWPSVSDVADIAVGWWLRRSKSRWCVLQSCCIRLHWL